MIIKRYHRAHLCGGLVLYLDCGDSYINLHMQQNKTIIHRHCISVNVLALIMYHN